MTNVILPRGKETNPLIGGCKLAYRRICGVCEHFDGEHMRDTAFCKMHQCTVEGRTNAMECQEWERKWAR